MSAKPTILLVGGAWHTPASYEKFTSALKAAGFDVHCPPMPSMNGARPPTADLDTDTASIRKYAEGLIDSGKNVAAIMHSYGGQVGTNALTGLGLASRQKAGKAGGVSRLIYMCAFAMPEGGSMAGKVEEMGQKDLIPLAFDFAEDDTMISRDPKTLVIGPGLDDDELDKYIGSFVRWNGKSMYQPIKQCAWREIPCTYLYTTQDMTVPLNYQTDMVEKLRAAGASVETTELASGHCPNATATAEVVEAVKAATAA